MISAEGEQNASRVLRDAANIMDESPASLQLRYLQTLNTIAAYNNHTYVFPLPVDLMMKLMSGMTGTNQGGGRDPKWWALNRVDRTRPSALTKVNCSELLLIVVFA